MKRILDGLDGTKKGKKSDAGFRTTTPGTRRGECRFLRRRSCAGVRLVGIGLLLGAGPGCRSWLEGDSSLRVGQVELLLAEDAFLDRLALTADVSAQGAFRLKGAYRMELDAAVCVPVEGARGPAGPFPLLRVDGGGATSRALVDTGASISLATFEWAEASGIRLVGPEPVRFQFLSFHGRHDAIVGVLPELRIGGLFICNVPVGVVNRLPGVSPFFEPGSAVGLLVGQDLMGQFGRVRFERGPRRVCWHGPKAPRDRFERLPQATCVLRFPARGLPRFVGEVGAQGPVDLVWDSGGDFGLWIPPTLALQWDLPSRMNPVASRLAAWLDPSMIRRVRPQSVRIGQLSIPQLTTYVGRIGAEHQEPDFVLLGKEILHRHTVEIDYLDREIRFF